MKRFRQIQAENADLCELKNRQYGDRSLKRFGALGVVVRMADKVERLATMVVENRRPGRKSQDLVDSVKDAFRDVGNYATIGEMLWDGTYDGVDSDRISAMTEGALAVLSPERRGSGRKKKKVGTRQPHKGRAKTLKTPGATKSSRP